MSEYPEFNFKPSLLQDCGEISFTPKWNPSFWPEGQLLRDGEPTAVQDCETGIWTTTYPFLFVPGPVTDAHSFGGPADYVPFVQASTVEV